MAINIQMKMFLSIAIVVCASSGALASDNCPQHTPAFAPSTKTESVEICHEGYSVQWDSSAKLPVWSSWTLDSEKTSGKVGRSNSFKSDPAAEKSSTPEDYLRSGYDRGHMADDADMRWSKKAESDSFYMTNMTPQSPKLNRGAWKELETETRKQAIAGAKLQIISGPIYVGEKKTIGSGVIVPRKFWKVVINLDTKSTKAYEYDQDSIGSPKNHETTIEQVESDSGVHFTFRSEKTE